MRILLIAVIASAAAATAVAQTSDGAYAPARDPAGGIQIRDRSEVPQCPNQGPVVLAPCDEGEELVLFDQPVLDNEDLFVVCTEIVPYCIPEGLRPEGDQGSGGIEGLAMRAMLTRFLRAGATLPSEITDLAALEGDGSLEDSTITCNSTTNICTCVSSEANGECEERLAAMCGSAESFGDDAGIGRDC